MAGYVDGPTRTFPNNSAIAQWTRVKLSGGYLTAAGIQDDDIGVLEKETQSTDPVGVVRLRTAQGTHKAIAAAAVTQYATVYTAAAGKVDDLAASGAIQRGIALTAATASGGGDIIEVMPISHGHASNA